MKTKFLLLWIVWGFEMTTSETGEASGHDSRWTKLGALLAVTHQTPDDRGKIQNAGRLENREDFTKWSNKWFKRFGSKETRRGHPPVKELFRVDLHFFPTQHRLQDYRPGRAGASCLPPAALTTTAAPRCRGRTTTTRTKSRSQCEPRPTSTQPGTASASPILQPWYVSCAWVSVICVVWKICQFQFLKRLASAWQVKNWLANGVLWMLAGQNLRRSGVQNWRSISLKTLSITDLKTLFFHRRTVTLFWLGATLSTTCKWTHHRAKKLSVGETSLLSSCGLLWRRHLKGGLLSLQVHWKRQDTSSSDNWQRLCAHKFLRDVKQW